jgi:tripeptide aminopeptidase
VVYFQQVSKKPSSNTLTIVDASGSGIRRIYQHLSSLFFSSFSPLAALSLPFQTASLTGSMLPVGGTMRIETPIDRIPVYIDGIEAIMETILANIVLLGQIPAPTFQEHNRTATLLERLAEARVDECTPDGYQNPIGIIRGLSQTQAPIFVVAHIDTPFNVDVDHNFTVTADRVSGAGVLDNSIGVGVLASLPEIFRRLDLEFQSDIVLAGVIQSIGKGNLRGIRHLLKSWSTPIRGAICMESADLGRISHYSEGMIRGEVICDALSGPEERLCSRPNAILVLNETIDQILSLRLPQRPHTEIVIGTISGGLKHGAPANEARLGFEIRSDSDDMVRSLYTDILDIVEGLGHAYEIGLTLETVSNINTARLAHNHPLVKAATQIMSALAISPVSRASESELSIFLSRNIPALTLGITDGRRQQERTASARIAPISRGIAQIIATIQAIDGGVCDDI